MKTVYVDKNAVIAKDGTVLTENVPLSMLAEKESAIKELCAGLSALLNEVKYCHGRDVVVSIDRVEVVGASALLNKYDKPAP